MLSELAITPDVFDAESFSDPVDAALAWERLQAPVCEECLVRDLYDGSWFPSLAAQESRFTPASKELLKHISRRLRRVAVCNDEWPQDDAAWCAEALASSAVATQALDCIVTTPATKASFASEGLVTSAVDVTRHPWWAGRSPSVSLLRTTQDYERVLGRVLHTAKSLMFIDPHLDPRKRGYKEFYKLLQHCHRPSGPRVHVEIHRVCDEGKGGSVLSVAQFQEIFEQKLKPKLSGVNVRLKVFIWPDFHDRALVTDLMCISMPNGFDIESAPRHPTHWSRLSRLHRDQLQARFDMAECPTGPNWGTFTLMP